ncbi:MAG: hypothetical protein NTY19_52190 [Planctomycetota bacterium]|nr:hypothetical protein [Planctomycetota bacterium]
MAYKESKTVIGYSGFDPFEECYGYHENACFLGDSRGAVASFMEDSGLAPGEFRVRAVTIAEIMTDYGASGGEFAMELAAFRRFSAIAAANDIRFQATPYEGDSSLMVVAVVGTKLRSDE